MQCVPLSQPPQWVKGCDQGQKDQFRKIIPLKETDLSGLVRRGFGGPDGLSANGPRCCRQPGPGERVPERLFTNTSHACAGSPANPLPAGLHSTTRCDRNTELRSSQGSMYRSSLLRSKSAGCRGKGARSTLGGDQLHTDGLMSLATGQLARRQPGNRRRPVERRRQHEPSSQGQTGAAPMKSGTVEASLLFACLASSVFKWPSGCSAAPS